MEQTFQDKQLKKHSIISTMSLFFQSGYASILGLISNIVLTVVLTPTVFGIYTIVNSIIPVLNYFSDIGLAASLIQKKELTEDDVKTTFTVQQILIISLISVGFLATPVIINFYQLPTDGAYLYWAMLVGFFLSSLKTIPSIFLERKIQFHKIVLVQVIESTFYNIILSITALLGFGLHSFTISILARSIIGLIAMYSISFWLPQIGISRASLKTLLKFGVPFQASSFLALFKDEFVTFYLGKALGLEALGYIGWAKKWAESPIRIIMDNISKVMFPTFSRLQHDVSKIGRLVEKILYYQTLLLAPTLLGMALIMPHFVFLIPKYSKWAPALPLFYIFVLSAFFSSYSTPFINVFNALGKVRLSFFFMVYWTIATWILTPTLTSLLGPYGFPVTQVFLSLTFIYILIQAKKIIQFSFLSSVTPSIVASLIMGASVYAITTLTPLSWISTIIAIAVGGATYILSLILFFRINPVTQLKTLFKYE